MYMKLQLLELSDSDYKITMFTVFKEIQRDKNYKRKHCILAKSKINCNIIIFPVLIVFFTENRNFLDHKAQEKEHKIDQQFPIRQCIFFHKLSKETSQSVRS